MPPKKISIRIDGEMVNASEGQTILEAAQAGGKSIPTLCYLKGLKAVGACRVCMVELAGVDRLFAACTTPVQDGMSVITNSPRLSKYRRITIELLLVERNHVCAVCVSNGHCELQDMAYALGITHVRFAYNFPRLPVDMSHPASPSITTAASCVPAAFGCVLISKVPTCGISNRGSKARLVSELNSPWGGAFELHELRQVRAGVPDRSAFRERQRRAGDGERFSTHHLAGA